MKLNSFKLLMFFLTPTSTSISQSSNLLTRFLIFRTSEVLSIWKRSLSSLVMAKLDLRAALAHDGRWRLAGDSPLKVALRLLGLWASSNTLTVVDCCVSVGSTARRTNLLAIRVSKAVTRRKRWYLSNWFEHPSFCLFFIWRCIVLNVTLFEECTVTCTSHYYTSKTHSYYSFLIKCLISVILRVHAIM